MSTNPKVTMILEEAKELLKVDYISNYTVSEMNGIHFVCKEIVKSEHLESLVDILSVLSSFNDNSNYEYSNAVRKKSLEFLRSFV